MHDLGRFLHDLGSFGQDHFYVARIRHVRVDLRIGLISSRTCDQTNVLECALETIVCCSMVVRI